MRANNLASSPLASDGLAVWRFQVGHLGWSLDLCYWRRLCQVEADYHQMKSLFTMLVLLASMFASQTTTCMLCLIFRLSRLLNNMKFEIVLEIAPILENTFLTCSNKGTSSLQLSSLFTCKMLRCYPIPKHQPTYGQPCAQLGETDCMTKQN